MNHESSVLVDSETRPGVSFRIARMSFARRLELVRRVRELARKAEFLDAGDSAREKIDAAILSAEIDQLYVRWGVLEVNGIQIDGAPATPELLADGGPEELFREAVSAVKAQCGLSDEERKN